MKQHIDELVSRIIDNYAKTGSGSGEDFAKSIHVVEGRKYIKIVKADSVWGFVVATDGDRKFKKGDILKPASFNSPTRNYARGNIIEGGYPVHWTGPAYMR